VKKGASRKALDFSGWDSRPGTGSLHPEHGQHPKDKMSPLMPSMEHLTEKERLTVLRVAKERSIRDWFLILVTYKHALRSSETASLTLDDLKHGFRRV